MARRKRRKSNGAEALALLLLVGVPLVVIVVVISVIARYPVLLILLLGGGGGLVAWRISPRQKRARELAEMRRRQAEIYAARVQAIDSYYSMGPREFEEASHGSANAMDAQKRSSPARLATSVPMCAPSRLTGGF